VPTLLDRQADLQAKNEEGQTALHLAAATGQPKLTRFLIERGADPQAKDFDGQTPLYYARKNHHPQTRAVLEVRGQKTEDRRQKGSQ
jgi:ankyrin repeat protein